MANHQLLITNYFFWGAAKAPRCPLQFGLAIFGFF
jgi:hypothetical protein